MTLEDIKQGESKMIEFKRELPNKSEKYIKSIVAFANSAGGQILV